MTNDHTSSSCKKNKDGHQKEASRTNIMGGSTREASVCLWQSPSTGELHNTLNNITNNPKPVKTKKIFSKYFLPIPPTDLSQQSTTLKLLVPVTTLPTYVKSILEHTIHSLLSSPTNELATNITQLITTINILSNQPSKSLPNLNTSPNVASIDSGASAHYAPVTIHCISKKSCIVSYTVSLLEQRTITSSHTATLDIPGLPMNTCKSYLFPK